MATQTLELEKKVTVKKKTESLFSKRRKKYVTDPLGGDNPVTVQVLGICSALAVTVKVFPTFIMAVAVTVVTMLSNVVISQLRNVIPSRIRIIVQLGIVAALVILVDQLLRAYLYDTSKLIGVYVGLIITNCIVMGRLEAFAMANKPYDSLLDGLGSGLGYAWIILTVSVVRELFGFGTFLDFPILSPITEAIGLGKYPGNGLMVSPIGAFMILGVIIWVQRYKSGHVEH